MTLSFLGIDPKVVMIIVWIVFIIGTAIIELSTADLVSIWFTIGGIGALIATFLNADVWLQAVIFVAISTIAIIATRPIAKKMQQKEIIKTNADRIIGQHAIVTKQISLDEIGEVKVEERTWRAVTNEDVTFSVGEKVKIEAISGAKLIITKLKENNEIIL